LQFLHSKATEAPQPGAGTAIKNLSAHIAQGMLFQAAQRRAQQQEPQEQQQCVQQHLRAQQGQQQQGTVPATAAVQASSTGAEQGSLQAVLMVLQRLESKVDRLADDLHSGLQQLSQRLDKLEG
jgi:hypothetical protein